MDGTTLHALSVRSPVPSAVPLVLLHGWPGSIVEFLPVLGPLTNPAAHGGDPASAFHLVIPSLPGYGFSGPLTEAGWTDGRTAAALAELMSRLGYDRYGVQGGDVGAFLAPLIGALAKDQVIGASYDFGSAKVDVAQRRWIFGADRTVNTQVGAVIPAGLGNIKLTWLRADQTGATAAQSANDSTLWGAGYVYLLSKRTALYAHAARIDNKGAAAFATAPPFVLGRGVPSGFAVPPDRKSRRF